MIERAAFICSHVLDGSRPVLLVSTEGGDWQFLCGETHEGETPHVVGMNHLVDRDPTLREVLDLPAGWEAERPTLNGTWIRREIRRGS